MQIDLSLPPALDKNWRAYLPKTQTALQRIKTAVGNGELPILSLVQTGNDLPALQIIADQWRDKFAHILILGTGGSSLGGKSAYALADAGFGPAMGPKLHFLDNVDPHTFSEFARAIDTKNLGVIAISKSGSTAETLAQLHHVLMGMPQNTWTSKVLILTEPTDNPLRRLGQSLGCVILDHHQQVGGRYSIFSNVGMLPVMLAGLSAQKLRAGAAAVLAHALSDAPSESIPTATGAALAMSLQTSGITQHVVMPYVDRLRFFAQWYQQLWAESLGKNGVGITPLAALGTVDQHSQLQLYLDGPRDKFFTLIMHDTQKQGDALREPVQRDTALGYLYGRSMGDLLWAEARATAKTLANRGLPLRVITLPTIDETTLGGLYMHYMLETILTADLLGVNPFDQPAVEEGKILTRDYMHAIAA